MSTRRITADGASLVCSVVKTRCPVSEARTAISAVSASRVSPTSTTSGSCRSTWRRPLANVSPILGFTWICAMPGRRYSTGSSIVITLRRVALSEPSAE